MCALTGLVLVSSIIAHPDISYEDGAKLTHLAFGKIPVVGTVILTVGIISFAFSTILGWSYYGERAVEYLGGKKIIKYYRLIWVVFVFVGAIIDLSLVWGIADSFNALMAIPNLLALLLLSGVIVAETKKYLWEGNIDDYSQEEVPVISDNKEDL